MDGIAHQRGAVMDAIIQTADAPVQVLCLLLVTLVT